MSVSKLNLSSVRRNREWAPLLRERERERESERAREREGEREYLPQFSCFRFKYGDIVQNTQPAFR